VRVDFEADGCTLTLGANVVKAGYSEWKEGFSSLQAPPETPVAAAARWSSPETLLIRILHTLSPTSVTVTLTFGEDEVAVDVLSQHIFGDPQGPKFTAKAI